MTQAREHDPQRTVVGRLQALRRRIRESVQSALEVADAPYLVREIQDVDDAALPRWLESLPSADYRQDAIELRAIDAALDRVAAGTYGWCSDCGESISDARLDIVPTAKRCLPCQALAERPRPRA